LTRAPSATASAPSSLTATASGSAAHKGRPYPSTRRPRAGVSGSVDGGGGTRRSAVGVQVDSGGLILKPSDRVLWTGRAIPARRGAGFHADRRPPPQVGVSGGISQQRAQATVRDFSRRRRQQLDFSRRRKRRNLCFSV
jgi:hypothetical protein